MKETRLVCDWCKPPRSNAVITLSLTNGKRTSGGPQLDLCAEHSKDLHASFRPKRHPGDVPRKNKPAKDYPKVPPDFDDKVLAAITKLKTASTGDVGKVLHVPRHQAAFAMKRLQEAKKLIKAGSGKFTHYQLAP